MSRGKGTRWRDLGFTWLLVGGALAAGYFEGVTSAILLVGILILYEVRHPTHLDQAEESTVLLDPEQLDQIEQAFYEIKLTLEGVKTDIREATTEIGGVKTEVEEVKDELAEVKTEIADVSADLAEVKLTVGDVKDQLADEDKF